MHERLSDLILRAQREDDHDSANRIFETAEQLAKTILHSHPRDAQAAFAIALTWYHRWAPVDRHSCLDWLRKTEALDPTFPWVPLYFGYQFFDDAKYSDAYEQFQRVDREFFASIGQQWRNLKTDELMLVCQIRGDFGPPDIDSLRRLTSNYIAANEEERALPVEIVHAISTASLRRRFNTEPPAVAIEAVRLINGTGNSKVFGNELKEVEAEAGIVG